MDLNAFKYYVYHLIDRQQSPPPLAEDVVHLVDHFFGQRPRRALPDQPMFVQARVAVEAGPARGPASGELAGKLRGRRERRMAGRRSDDGEQRPTNTPVCSSR